MADKLHTLPAVTISAAGTRVQITTVETGAVSVIIQGDADNTGSIFVGDSSVTAASGIEIVANETVEISPPGVNGAREGLILSDLYVDADTSGNKARISYLKRR